MLDGPVLDGLLLAAACAVGAGLLGLAVPRLVSALPEPVPATRRLGVGAAGLSAALGALIAWAVGPSPALVGLVPLVPVGVALAVVDARTRLLPRVVVLPATAALLVLGAVGWLVTGDGRALGRAIVAMLLARSLYWVLWYVRSAGMGFGDVRLAALVGLALGYLGWPELVVGLYAGFLVFGVPGALVALVRRDRSLLRTAFPFGPAMLAGAVLGIVLGDPVVAALGAA